MLLHPDKKKKLLQALNQIMSNLDGINSSNFDAVEKQALKDARKSCEHMRDLVSNWDVEISDTFFNQVEDFQLKGLFFAGCFIVTIALIYDFALSMPFRYLEDWTEVLGKLSVTLPLVWAAIFFLKRRNESARLKEEYRHKSTVVASYMSFKKQIKEMGVSDHELEKKLMGTALDAIAHNPAKVLDAKQNTKSETLFEEAMGQVKALSDKVEKIIKEGKAPKS